MPHANSIHLLSLVPMANSSLVLNWKNQSAWAEFKVTSRATQALIRGEQQHPGNLRSPLVLNVPYLQSCTPNGSTPASLPLPPLSV